MISIVIPTFNNCCTNLVQSLAAQATGMPDLQWEIIVGDDASTNKEVVAANQTINNTPHCRYVRREKNEGRAVIRNFLAHEAKGNWLLFIDGDARMIDDRYLSKFLHICQQEQVCYGGYTMMPGPQGNLRWLYEHHAAPRHTVTQRRLHPYQDFKICNLLIERKLFLAHPLDVRFRKYGYEDVELGRQLQLSNVRVCHIDAPVGFFDYESNEQFVAKTEEALQTLWMFRNELHNHSSLLRFYGHLNGFTKNFIDMIYQLFHDTWRKNLISASPALWIFNLYKVSRLVHLSLHEAEQKDEPATDRHGSPSR